MKHVVEKWLLALRRLPAVVDQQSWKRGACTPCMQDGCWFVPSSGRQLWVNEALMCLSVKPEELPKKQQWQPQSVREGENKTLQKLQLAFKHSLGYFNKQHLSCLSDRILWTLRTDFTSELLSWFAKRLADWFRLCEKACYLTDRCSCRGRGRFSICRSTSS